EVRLAEVRSAEVRLGEVRPAEVWTDDGVLATPRVPGVHALLKDRLVGRHKTPHAINQVGQTSGLTRRLRQPAIADVAERSPNLQSRCAASLDHLVGAGE